VSERAQQAAALARRCELLELQAHLQRVTLAATLAEFEARRSAFWVGALARAAASLWSTPRIRWALLATVSQQLLWPLLRRLFRHH
jgi:hypothetical protein